MEITIEKLRIIILENPELSEYIDFVNDDLTEIQIMDLISKILSRFNKFFGKSERPKFITELQQLLNLYGIDNTYPPSQIKN